MPIRRQNRTWETKIKFPTDGCLQVQSCSEKFSQVFWYDGRHAWEINFKTIVTEHWKINVLHQILIKCDPRKILVRVTGQDSYVNLLVIPCLYRNCIIWATSFRNQISYPNDFHLILTSYQKFKDDNIDSFYLLRLQTKVLDKPNLFNCGENLEVEQT